MRMMKLVFQSYIFHIDLKTFPPPFQDEILIMENWKGLADVQFSPEAARISFRQSKTTSREGEFALHSDQGPKEMALPSSSPRKLMGLF